MKLPTPIKTFILIINIVQRFLGIVIARGGCGLRSWCIVRNVIEGQGVEFRFELYSPTLINVDVIKLEKRLDDELYYLRDAPKVTYSRIQNTAL